MEKGFFGYRVAAGCFLIMVVHLGFLGIIGIYIPHFSKEFNIPISQAALTVTFATLSAFFFSLFAARAIAQFTAKKMLLIATCICATHFVILGSSQNIITVYCSALLSGSVMGLGTNAVVASIISDWFIEKRATILGLVFSGTAFGTAIAFFLAGILIDQFGWRHSYFILAALIFITGLCTNFFLIKSPKQLNQHPLGFKKLTLLPTTAGENYGLSWHEAKKTPTFIVWWLAILLTTMSTIGYNAYTPALWQSYGMSPLLSSNLISLLSLFGAISVMLSGIVADRFGPKIYVTYIMLGYFAGTLLLVLFPFHAIPLTVVTLLLVSLVYPTSSSLGATLTTVGFGTKDYTKITAQFMTAGYLSRSILPIIGIQLEKITGTILSIYILQLVFAVIALGLFWIGFIKMPVRNKISLKKPPMTP